MIGIVSSVASRSYAMQYPNGELLPLGEYICCSQPPATGKSRVLKTFMGEANRINTEAINTQKKRYVDWLKACEKSESDNKPEWTERTLPRLFMTDATPEAIDKSLSGSDGFFSLASAEQGLINSIMGTSYQNGKANNDLALKGFNGEFHASARANRDGFVGDVVGSITCFAQSGGIETILNTSEGVGFAERFLMLDEPDRLGKRDHTKRLAIDYELHNQYKDITGRLAIKACRVKQEGTSHTLADLHKLELSNTSWQNIALFRNEIEPELADDGKYSTALMRGMAGKADIHIMKIASTLHLLHGNESNEVCDDLVIAAINIMRDLLEYMLHLMQKYELSGRSAYENSVIEYIGKKRECTRSDLKQAKRKTKPWLQINDTSKRNKKMDYIIDSLIRRQVVIESELFDSNGKSKGKLLRLL